jgi:predicted O-methyltransferase YrrM
VEIELLNELLGATRTKHLRFGGQGILRGGFVRSMKILLSPRTGNLGHRLKGMASLFSLNKIQIRLPKPRILPTDFIRLEPWEMEYLFALARQSKIGIVETGRFRGGSALVLSTGAAQVPIWSIDIAPQDDVSLQLLMRELGVGKNISLIVGDSTAEISDVGEFDLLWIDGDHSFVGCTGDIRRWWPRLTPGGSMALHDCYLGSEVMDAVSEFLATASDAQIVVGVLNTRAHFRSPTGSLCHIRKLPVA